MDNFFRNILNDLKTNIPELIRNNFSHAFPNAINVEWFLNCEVFEAVFHENDLEKIVIYDKNGLIIETKINISKSSLPIEILNTVNTLGEIMNVILIISGEKKNYEIIFRDEKLTRFQLNIDENGSYMEKKLL
jgi:hypothetical protein